MTRYNTDPVYRLCLGMVRQTITNALSESEAPQNGAGLDRLAWLFSPTAQETLRHALDLPPDQTLLVTCRTVERLAGLVGTEAGERLHQLIAGEGSPGEACLKQIQDTLRGEEDET